MDKLTLIVISSKSRIYFVSARYYYFFHFTECTCLTNARKLDFN